MILADTFTSLFETLGWNLTRSESLLIITILVLLPLCLLKSLEILAPTSLLGSFAMFATAVAMGIRYFDGSYEEDGQFYGSTPPDLQPSFGNIGALGALNPRSLILVCMFYEAFIAHYK
jgi:amino acid permease